LPEASRQAWAAISVEFRQAILRSWDFDDHDGDSSIDPDIFAEFDDRDRGEA
jgi:hypothetical protein